MNYALVAVLLGTIAFLIAVAMLLVYLRRERAIGAVAKRDDLASMMILLQTMRDLLEQQKGFARELNKALDARVEFIKQTVESARAEMTAMGESIRQLHQELDRIKREGQSASAPPHAPSPAAPANVRRLSAYAPAHPEPPAPKEHERPALRVLAMPRGPDTAGDALDSWVGLDFAGDEPDPLGFEVPDTEPEAPHDADAARSAFRALLDLAPERDVERDTLAAAPPMTRADRARPAPPLHMRVYEYNDAGMSVAEIAQELGIGKGEVRLIISLRNRNGG